MTTSRRAATAGATLAGATTAQRVAIDEKTSSSGLPAPFLSTSPELSHHRQRSSRPSRHWYQSIPSSFSLLRICSAILKAPRRADFCPAVLLISGWPFFPPFDPQPISVTHSGVLRAPRLLRVLRAPRSCFLTPATDPG